MLRVHESETASGKQRVWMLSRNCALTASALIAAFFVLRGAWMVLPFSVLEMSALGFALLVYARHAVDCETVSLRLDTLEIESVDGNRRLLTRVDPRTVRVEIDPRERCGVAVVTRGKRIAVGRFVCERERRRFARELRQALSAAG